MRSTRRTRRGLVSANNDTLAEQRCVQPASTRLQLHSLASPPCPKPPSVRPPPPHPLPSPLSLTHLPPLSAVPQDEYDDDQDDDDLDYPHPEDAGGDANPLFPGVVPPVQGQKPFEAVKGGKPQLPPLRGDRFTLGPLKFHPQEFRTEALLLALFALYALATFFLRRFNTARAKTWYTANAPILRSEFAGVGLANEALFAKDGGDEYVSYATGRRGVESAWVRLTTGGQDALAWVYEQVRGVSDAAWDSGAGKVVRSFSFFLPRVLVGARRGEAG